MQSVCKCGICGGQSVRQQVHLRPNTKLTEIDLCMCDLNGHLIFAIPNAQVPFSFLIPFSLSRSVFLFRITYAHLFLVGSPLRFLFNSNSKHERSHTHNPTCFLIVRSPTNLSSVDPSKLWLFNLAILFSHEQLHSIDASLWLLLLFQCVCVCVLFFLLFENFSFFLNEEKKIMKRRKSKGMCGVCFLKQCSHRWFHQQQQNHKIL